MSAWNGTVVGRIDGRGPPGDVQHCLGRDGRSCVGWSQEQGKKPWISRIFGRGEASRVGDAHV